LKKNFLNFRFSASAKHSINTRESNLGLMKWKKFLKRNWKKILIILVIFSAWYLLGSIGLVYIPGFGFESGSATLEKWKQCTCIGIPNNNPGFGGSTFYCIGIPVNCHCYTGSYYQGKLYNITEADCTNFNTGI
jgi:hypothetical protein